MNFIVENREWIFSGIGVFFISLFIGIVRHKRKVKHNSSSDITNISRTVTQYGDKSIYIKKNNGDINMN